MLDYFLIYQFDTDCTVRRISKDEIEQGLENDDFPDGFLSQVKDNDPATWGGQALLVKGEIIIPQTKEVVRKWSVE